MDNQKEGMHFRRPVMETASLGRCGKVCLEAYAGAEEIKQPKVEAIARAGSPAPLTGKNSFRLVGSDERGAEIRQRGIDLINCASVYDEAITANEFPEELYEQLVRKEQILRECGIEYSNLSLALRDIENKFGRGLGSRVEGRYHDVPVQVRGGEIVVGETKTPDAEAEFNRMHRALEDHNNFHNFFMAFDTHASALEDSTTRENYPTRFNRLRAARATYGSLRTLSLNAAEYPLIQDAMSALEKKHAKTLRIINGEEELV